MFKSFRKIIFGLNIFVIVATLLAYASPFISPEMTSVFSYFGLIYPWLLLLNLLFLLAWVLVKKPLLALASFSVILLGWFHIQSFINFSSEEESKPQNSLEIVTFNTQNAYYSFAAKKENRDFKKEAFSEFISNSFDPDIFCGQEVGLYAQEILDTALDAKYKHTIKYKGAVIYSKHPIINKGQIDFSTKTNSCLYADIATPYCTLRVYSVHLQSNNISRDADKVLDEVDFQDSDTWKGFKGILSKYKKTSAIRAMQATEVKAHIEQSPYPVVLCGDLNDPPQSFTYRLLSKNLNDSFLKKGNGLGTTFGGRIPALRIDYIFVDPELTLVNHKVIKDKFSDHFPVLSKITCD